MSGIDKETDYLDSLKPRQRHPIWDVVEEDAELRERLGHFRCRWLGYMFHKESDQPITLTGLHNLIMAMALIDFDQWMQKERGLSLAEYCQEKTKSYKKILVALEEISHD